MPRKRPNGTRAPNGTSSVYLGKDGKWHGRVTMGTRDDGRSDRRHIEGKTEKDVIEKVRKLERQRDDGNVRKPGRAPTVEQWLTHWVENIAALTVRPNTLDGYRVAVNRHLILGLGAHRIDKIQPDHFEKLYVKMTKSGLKAATAHQVHRTARTAFGEAFRRGLIAKNPVALARPPRIDEFEVEPYSVDEVHRLLKLAADRRNGARFVIALALGLRQGEALGLMWADVDLGAGTLTVRRARQRPKWRHGCEKPCGRAAGFCRQKVSTRAATGPVKSNAGRRTVGLPVELVTLLCKHQEQQDRERTTAADLWHDEGWVFAMPDGSPLNPNTDYRAWKRLLSDAGLRDGRLHDARHTAATVLLILGVPERAVMELMGWSNTAMARRYQHLVKRVRDDIAKRLGGLLWDRPDDEAA
jgi:integrase